MIRFFAPLVAAVLVSCGGGGAAPTAASAEGLWTGTSTSGYGVNALVLENGEIWGLYGAGTSIYGALFGNLTVNGTSLSGSGSDFNILARTVTAGTFTGSASTKNTISVATSSGGSFSGTYNSFYDQAPTALASLAGTFSGTGVTGRAPVQAQTVTVSATGALTSSVTGCLASGQATLRASGKTVYNITVTFTGASCALGSGTVVNGVAIYSPTTRQLTSMGLTGSKSDGFIFVGTK